jgi:predicted DNA-binding transcriptional regulator AlpA
VSLQVEPAPQLTNPVLPQDEIFLTAPNVCARYSISDMTLWRWLHDGALGFPQPIYINRLRYFRLSALVAWERERKRD